jgi:Flp pilus assembly protein TadD
VGNWLKKLFRGKPQLTAEEAAKRKTALVLKLAAAGQARDPHLQLQVAEEILELAPKDTAAWNARVFALRRLGRPGAAEKAQLQAEELGVEIVVE